MSEKGKNINGRKKITFGRGFKTTIKIAVCTALVFASIATGLLAGVTVGCIITTQPLTREELYETDYVTKIYDSKGNVICQLTGSS